MILCIETGTDICSVGLVADGRVVALRESSGERDHARLVAVYAEEVLAEAGIGAGHLSAVAVSKGPGSYTGLRIGVSFAKGLCYGLGIPLVGVGSLESLCELARNTEFGFSPESDGHEACDGTRPAMCSGPDDGRNAADDTPPSRKIFVPMIDARRMEVYGQVFDAGGTPLTPPEAWIIDRDSLAGLRGGNGESGNDGGSGGNDGNSGGNRVFIFGSGAEKCRETLPWAHFIDVKPSAVGMARLATEALAAGTIEDVAYFEPFYLKDFVITTSQKPNYGIRRK